MDWERLVNLTKDNDCESLFAKIDVEVTKDPSLAAAGNRCKAILDHVYAASAEGGELAAQMGEIFDGL